MQQSDALSHGKEQVKKRAIKTSYPYKIAAEEQENKKKREREKGQSLKPTLEQQMLKSQRRKKSKPKQ